MEAPASLPSVMRSLHHKDAATYPGAAQAVDRARMEFHDMERHRQLGLGSRGDLLAVVQFPDTRALACDGTPWESFQLRLDSAKLLATGSAEIQTMLSPRKQRTFRLRLGIEHLPPGITYVVDFTPPLEGVELAEMTAALWLPRMVKLWFLAGLYVPDEKMSASRPYKAPVSALLCLGHDDLCRNLNNNCWSEIKLWKPDTNVKGIYESEVAGFHDVADYCRVRHYASIVRLLLAINSDAFDSFLLLNSAVRMWTMAQVAIRLDLHKVVVDPVSSWLLAAPNTKFLEICPERAYQLALDLQIPDVLTTAFKILVGERAVDFASPVRAPRVPPRTWAERQRDEYGDLPTDAIEYAAEALVGRVRGELARLRGDENLEMLFSRSGPDASTPMWTCLCQTGDALRSAASPSTAGHPPPSDGPVAFAAWLFEGFMGALRELVRRWVESTFGLVDVGALTASIEAERKHYLADSQRTPIHHLYMALDNSQKALTRIFWRNLQFQSGTVHSSRAGAFLTTLAPAIRDAIDSGQVPQPETERLEHLWRDFDIHRFMDELRHALVGLCKEMQGDELARDGAASADKPFIFSLSSHLLLHLTANELRYLPLWAGGDDDDTGGVFQPAIPPADMGPVAPGPGYHTGHTVAAAASSTAAPTATTAMDVEDSADTSTIMSASSAPGVNTPPGSPVPPQFVAGAAPSPTSSDGLEPGNATPTATASTSVARSIGAADPRRGPALPPGRNRALSLASSSSTGTERIVVSTSEHEGGVDPFGLEASDDDEEMDMGEEEDDDEQEHVTADK